MTLKAMVVAIMATTCLACAGQGGAKEEDGPLGKLSLNLIGSDRHGAQYRLREAEFDVTSYGYYPGNPNQTVIALSTETNPMAATIDQKLVSGSYNVTLSNRLWYLERLTANGPERVEQAVLLSEPSVYTYVYEGSTSDVYFTFGVGGELIDFRSGTLRIGISVELPDEDGGVAPPDNDAAIL
jgi:hypothetical protein